MELFFKLGLRRDLGLRKGCLGFGDSRIVAGLGTWTGDGVALGYSVRVCIMAGICG